MNSILSNNSDQIENILFEDHIITRINDNKNHQTCYLISAELF